MTIKTLAAKGQSNHAIARQLDLCEGTFRYHLRRLAANAGDGRSQQARVANSCREAIDHWMGAHNELSNLAALHELARRPSAIAAAACARYSASCAKPSAAARARSPSRRDAAWRPSPGRLGELPRRDRGRRGGHAACVSHGTVAVARVRGGVGARSDELSWLSSPRRRTARSSRLRSNAASAPRPAACMPPSGLIGGSSTPGCSSTDVQSPHYEKIVDEFKVREMPPLAGLFARATARGTARCP